jgi:hypothetical protein
MPTGIDAEQLRRLAGRILDDPPLAILIAGSYATRTEHAHSDLDVLVITERRRWGRAYFAWNGLDLDMTLGSPDHFRDVLGVQRSAGDVNLFAHAIPIDDGSGLGAELVALARRVASGARTPIPGDARFTVRHRAWSLLDQVRTHLAANRTTEARLCAGQLMALAIETHAVLANIWASGLKSLPGYLRERDPHVWSLVEGAIAATDAQLVDALTVACEVMLAPIGGVERYGPADDLVRITGAA